MKVCDRRTGNITDEKQYKAELLTFLYKNPVGRILLKLATMPVYSKFNGWLNDQGFSVSKIKPFIEKYRIDMDLYEKREYLSFNEFFIRKPRSVNVKPNGLLSPCEAKLMAYRISDELKVRIKNSDYTLSELTGAENLSGFRNGVCLVFHLTMDCCHRYYFIDDGCVHKKRSLKGKLHTVSSISKDYKIFKENHRVVSLQETENFGTIYYIEVGALQVGKIINHELGDFVRGQEKGYFKLGGSTIILLIKDRQVIIDEDIWQNSKSGVETRVSILEKIGVKYVR